MSRGNGLKDRFDNGAEKMKAAVLYQTGEPLVVEDGLVAPELLPGQVLVKIAYSGLCRSQLMEVRGCRGRDAYLPHLLGHEGVGRVMEVGSAVTKVVAGDKVVLTWIKGEGLDHGGIRYRLGGDIINAGPVTTLNEYAVVSENRCVKLPADIPADSGVLLGCAIPTGAGIIFNEVQLTRKSTLAIWGLGGIGMSAILAARLYDNPVTIAVDVNEEKLALAGEFGASHLINARKMDPVQEIMEITGGRGVDFCVEAAGTTATIGQAFMAVRDGGGCCVFASHPPTGQTIRLDPHALIRGKLIRGSWGGAVMPDRDLPRFFDLLRKGKLPLEKLLSRRYDLSEINRAMQDLEENRILRGLIEIDPTCC